MPACLHKLCCYHSINKIKSLVYYDFYGKTNEHTLKNEKKILIIPVNLFIILPNLYGLTVLFYNGILSLIKFLIYIWTLIKFSTQLIV